MSVPEARDTKERILDAAERLFAERGLSATSLRAITAAADVNLAAVNYHFGSKEQLVEAVVARRLAPINAERLRRLDALESAGRSGDIDALVEAFVGPALRIGATWGGTDSVMRMIGHVMNQADDSVRGMFAEQFREVFMRFGAALHRGLPHLDQTDVLWRLMFTAGAMAHTMAMAREAALLSDGRVDPTDADEAVRRLVPFLAAGLRSPAPVTP